MALRPRSISCLGALGKKGECIIAVHAGETILTVPPGETARLNVHRLFELIDALKAARDEMFRAES